MVVLMVILAVREAGVRFSGSPYKTVQVVKKMLGILCKPLIYA
jgi:hypothetical protein